MSGPVAAVVPLRPRAGGRRRSPFRPDIEGLRAIAVVAVVAFHARIPFLHGGYVGVDVFFVISGFLITGQLAREALTTGRIEVGRFYARRARRILPAASIVVAASAVGAFLLMPALGAYRAMSDLLAAAVYTANWHFIRMGTDYLAQSSSSSPALHFWSLAVEEQFYLAWPFLLLAATWLARRAPLHGTAILTVAVLIPTAASVAASLVLTGTEPKLAYMATTTRAWEFGVGAIVAVIAHWLEHLGSRAGARIGALLLGVAGITGIAWSCLAYTEYTSFPGVAAFVPVGGAAAVIAAGLLSGGHGVGRLLAAPPMRFVGRASYAWYLWHWPLLVLVESRTGRLTWPWAAAVMVAALALAVLTLWLVDQPISRWRAAARSAGPALAVGLLGTALAAGTTLGLGRSLLTTLAVAPAHEPSHVTFDRVFGTGKGGNSGAVSPTALEASKDIPVPATCMLDEQVTPVAPCAFGPPDGRRVVLFGDSHAQQWLPALEPMALRHGWRITVFAKAGCPVPAIAPRHDGSRFSQPGCTSWRSAAIRQIIESRPSLVIVSSQYNYIPDSGELLTSWKASLGRLRATNAPIAYLRDTPFPGKDIPTCISSALNDWAKCSFANGRWVDPVITQARLRIHVIDLSSYLCPGSVCPAVRNGVLLYRDDSHLTATAAALLEPAMDAAFAADGLTRTSTGR